MGCFESREVYDNGKIHFIEKKQYDELLADAKNGKIVPLDCSVDTQDGKFVAADIFAKRRIL
jgi:hypothetical protein